MRKYLIPILLVLLIAVGASAWAVTFQGKIQGKIGSVVFYLFEENFETDPGYDETWDGESGPTIDEDCDVGCDADAPLRGNLSLLMSADAASEQLNETLAAEVTEVYLYFQVRPRVLGVSDIFKLKDSGAGTTRCFLAFGNDGNDEFKFGDNEDFGEGYTDFNGIDINTTYHIWFEFVRGSGADGSCELFVSTDGTKGAADVSIQNITFEAVDGADRFRFWSTAATAEYLLDRFLYLDSPIGDNP